MYMTGLYRGNKNEQLFKNLYVLGDAVSKLEAFISIWNHV